ncbi:MAG: TonB-dependent receptor [Pseudomonadota bacterium]
MIKIIVRRVLLLTLLAGFSLSSQLVRAQDNQLELPSQSLGDTLISIANHFQTTVLASDELVRDKTSAPVKGQGLSVLEAVDQSLAGPGLVAKLQGNAILISQLQQAASSAGQVAQVTVKDEPKEEIIVRGQLLERDLQDSQTSVSVVTGEELRRRSDLNLRETVKRIAGVSSSARGLGFVVRGVDERGVSGNGGSSPAVSTTVDGARISNFGRRSTTFVSTWDLEQVEFLRGPQSTQTGRNAIAGSVVVRSKDPTDEHEVNLRLGIGNGGTAEGAFALNQPLSDRVAVRVAGEITERDGFVDNPTLNRDDEAAIENKSIRAAIKFDPNEKFSAIFKLSYLESFDGFASSDLEPFPERVVFTDADSEDEGEYSSANLRMSYELSDSLKLESETTYVDREFTFISDFDGTPLNLGIGSALEEGDSIEQEIRLLYSTEQINAVVGAFYSKIEDNGTRTGTVPASLFLPGFPLPPGLLISGVLPSTGEATNFAVFGELEYELNPRLTLVVGGRYDDEDQDRSNESRTEASIPAFNAFLPPATFESTSTSYDAFLPKAGLVYDLADDVSLGFTYQRGYRAGGASFNFFTSVQSDFDPEFTDNFELSLRSQWMDGRVTVNANAYYIDWSDQQVRIFGPSGNTLDVTTQNAGESELYGLELEARATPREGVELYGLLGLNETKFEDFVVNGEQLAGNEFRNAPDVTGAIGGTWEFASGWFFSADASYTSSAFGDAQNTPSTKSDSRFLVDTRIGYETDRYSVFLYADNLFDEEYLEEGPPVAGNLITIGDPRTYGVVGQIRY